MGALVLRRCGGAFFVHDTPNCTDDTAVGLRSGDDGFDFCRGVCGCRWGCVSRGESRDTPGGGTLSDAGTCVACDLGAAEDCLERETNGHFQTGAEEGEHAPHGGVEDGVEREVSFQEEGCRGEDEVWQTRVQNGYGDQVGRDGRVSSGKEFDGAEERPRAMRGRSEDKECAGRVDGCQDEG